LKDQLTELNLEVEVISSSTSKDQCVLCIKFSDELMDREAELLQVSARLKEWK